MKHTPPNLKLPAWIKSEAEKRRGKFRTALILVNTSTTLKDLNRKDRRDLARQARLSPKGKA